MSVKFKVALVIYLCSSAYCASAQGLTKSEVSFLMKLTLFQSSYGNQKYVASQQNLQKFLKLEFQMDTLGATGFDDYIFVSINPRYQNPDSLEFDDGPFLLTDCDRYVVALHKRDRSLFRLKGFIQNDFPLFIGALKSLGYKNCNSVRHFVSNYSVASLDLRCLFNAFNNLSVDSHKYPCLSNCSGLRSLH